MVYNIIDKKKLHMLNPREYEHPLDKKALDTLKDTPGLEKLTKEFYKHGLERVLRVQYTGSYLKVTDSHFPKVKEDLKEVCNIIHLTNIPDLYIENNYGINGFAVGAKKPMIVITRRAIDWLSHEELLGLLGHEAGHIKSMHMMYHDMAQLIPTMGDLLSGSTFGVGKIVAVGLEAVLYYWYGMSELTADRAGLLTCQDNEAYIQLLMKIAGVPKKYYKKIETEEFIKQAREFEDFDYNSLDKIAKAATIMWQQHPWTVLRAHELIKWIESGKYQELIEKHGKENISEIELICTCGGKLKGNETFCGICGEKISTR